MERSKLDEFTRGFFECALWSSTDNSREDGGDHLDLKYDLYDFANPCFDLLVEECKQFQIDNWSDIACAKDMAHAGHDFWLTRCGHGAGFWDGDYPKDVGDRLTEECGKYGSVDLYVGDDGQIWAMGYETPDHDFAWKNERHPKRLGGG